MAVGSKTEAQQDGLRGTLPPGTRLRNYELISVLGQGGFGITYYARDTTLGREVAIKEYLPTSLALREDGTLVVPRSTQLAEDFIWGRERFLEEARILATLEDVPAVVRVYDFLEANGTAYMVMGLARGDTLEQRLKRDKQLPPATVEQMLERLLDGLEEVHKAGFLHRDIKPANIILDAHDNPTLIDFGASRASIADRTAAMTAIFTPRYAAAEQLTSDRQGPWTDIYGLSATVYHAITGRPPPSSLERALNDTYSPLAMLAPAGLSPAMLKAIDAGLAVRANDRPQSIAIWRKSLSSAASAADDSTVVRVRSNPRNSRKAAALVVPPPSRAEPSRAAGPAATLDAAGRRRTAFYGGAILVAVLLAAGGYWVSSTKPAAWPVAAAPSASDHDEAARQTADADARQKTAAKVQQDEVEGRQKAAAEVQKQAEARQKAEAEAALKAGAEARQKAEAEAQSKVAAEARLKAEAEAKQKAEDEARQKAEAEAVARQAAAEAQRKADAAAKQKADADAANPRAAEAAEAGLKLSQSDRQRLQVALTSLGFDTQGVDGVFGPRSREMILDWQQARKRPPTGFLTAPEQQAILSEAASALAKYDDDLKKADAAAKARAAASPARPTYSGGVSCQDTSGRRIDFPNVTTCPYGLAPAR